VGPLKLFYAQFEELESFSKFGTQLDAETLQRIKRGQAIRQVLEQRQYQTLSAAEQVAIFMATNAGLFDGISVEENGRAQQKVLEVLHTQFVDVVNAVNRRQRIAPEVVEQMLSAWRSVLAGEEISADVA
jgi:F-type H+-transporting ATPase subunit alpha